MLVYMIIFYVFGVIFYEYAGLQYIDELLTLALICFVFVQQCIAGVSVRWMPLVGFFIISLFFLLYSMCIHSNSNSAIIMDYAIQVKPFLAFFCIRIFDYKIPDRHKKILNKLSVICAFLLLFVGCMSFAQGLGNGCAMWVVFKHPSRYATAVIITAMVYYLSSSKFDKNKIYFFLILGCGMFSAKGKYYGFLIGAIAFIGFNSFVYFKKIDFKTVIVAIIISVLVGYIGYDKIYYYFIHGTRSFEFKLSDHYINDGRLFARPALYISAFYILLDYFPLGSGFASFGTHASQLYYSDIYFKYGLNNLWGLSPEKSSFITDTYYPILAQFGVVGILLYIFFWIFIIKKIVSFADFIFKEKDIELIRYFNAGVLIVYFFIIESVADSTMIQNRGVFVMILLATVMNNIDSFSLKSSSVFSVGRDLST